MRKIISLILIITLSLLPLSGCVDYVGVDKLSVVAGLTIDESDEPNALFHLCFEIVNTTDSEEQEKKSIIVEADGMSINEAISNANTNMYNDMYFGNTNLLVISHQLAEKMGINLILESVMRNFSMRDTINIVVSKGQTAKETLYPNKQGKMIFSYEMAKALDWQNEKVNSTRSSKIYDLYENLKIGTSNITLPAFVFNNDLDQPQPQIEGMGIFKGDELIGWLEKLDVQYFMYAMEELTGGTFTFFLDKDDKKSVTLTVTKSFPKRSYKYENDNLTLMVDVEINCNISGLSPEIGELTQEIFNEIQNQASEDLSVQVKKLINKMQQDPGADIYEFGTEIYRNDPKLWNSLKENWEEHFRGSLVIANTKFIIKNTGIIDNF